MLTLENLKIIGFGVTLLLINKLLKTRKIVAFLFLGFSTLLAEKTEEKWRKTKRGQCPLHGYYKHSPFFAGSLLMSRSIEFTASFGDETKHVDLSYVDLSDYYHIYIDKFYYGLVVHRNGKWTVLLQKPEAMTMDDIQAIEEIIEESVRADS